MKASLGVALVALVVIVGLTCFWVIQWWLMDCFILDTCPTLAHEFGRLFTNISRLRVW